VSFHHLDTKAIEQLRHDIHERTPRGGSPELPG
jgi:hypothetical protein